MRRSPFIAHWIRITGLAALTVSCVDALLLQRSRGLFTGGFLADDVLGGGDAVLFFLLSVVIDAGVAGALAFAALQLLSRLRVTTRAAFVGGFLAATGPLLLADAISYQLLRYLGAGFDLDLMFDLAGRSVSEIFAVAASHVWLPALVVLALTVTAGATVWLINRREGAALDRPARRTWPAPIVLGLASSLTLAAAVSAHEAAGGALLRKPSGQLMQWLVSAFTDVDRDGFGLIGRLSDPDPFNAAVFPYAVDVPGNGVDEDGVAGDLPADAAGDAETSTESMPWQRTPDIVFIVLESFRADLLGAALNGRPITPVLNELSARGLAAPRAYSHNGYTVQSRFHILAGSLVVQPNSRTLIDDAKSNGYTVGYFSGQDETFGNEVYRVGFDRADVAYDARADVAARYTTFTTPGSLAVPYQLVEHRIADFVRDRGPSAQPMFLYVNFGDTHFPYSHGAIESLISDVRLSRGEISPGRREELFAMYANTAANIDRSIGTVIEMVRRQRGREPAIVVTSDHGESLFDSGFLGHGYALNDVQTRVPLVVANLPMKVPDPFGHVELRAALQDALRQPPDLPSTPTLCASPRPVFQYLGDLRRPREIGFLRDGVRLVYDFRTTRVRSRDGRWGGVTSLEPAESNEFRQLVQDWERINLASRAPLSQ